MSKFTSKTYHVFILFVIVIQPLHQFNRILMIIAPHLSTCWVLDSQHVSSLSPSCLYRVHDALITTIFGWFPHRLIINSFLERDLFPSTMQHWELSETEEFPNWVYKTGKLSCHKSLRRMWSSFLAMWLFLIFPQNIQVSSYR